MPWSGSLAFAAVVALAIAGPARPPGRAASMSLSRHLILIVSASVGVAILGVATAMGLLARDALVGQAENQARLVAGLIAGEANRTGVISDRDRPFRRARERARRRSP